MFFSAKEILGGVVAIICIIVVMFGFMVGLTFVMEKGGELLQWIDKPMLTVVVLLGAIILYAFFFAFAKLAEFGFNIRSFVNSIKNFGTKDGK